MYKIYILQSLRDGRTYVGYTKDLEKRLIEHNSGKVKATKRRRPFKIIYAEDVANLNEAKRREIYWKSGSGKKKIETLF